MKLKNKLLLGEMAALSYVTPALADDVVEIGDPGTTNILTDDLVLKINNVLSALQTIGFIIAIVMIIYVGIKYLTSGAGKKAEAKDTLIPIVIGAGLIVLSTTIAKALFGAFA